MVDLLGPADAGSINTLTTTGDVTSPVTGDTWFQDCAGGVSGTGTDEVAKYLNRMLQQLRVAIRKSNAPLSNAYDNMLAWAIQSGYDNFIGTAGGTANALTGSVPSSPISVPDGTVYRGFTSTPNTGAATYNHQGLGALPILLLDGTPLSGDEMDGAFVLMKAGSNWYLLSAPSGGDPLATTGVGAVVIAYPNITTGYTAGGSIGLTGVWLPGVGVPQSFAPGPGWQTADIRFGGANVPGTWEIQSVTSDSGYSGTISTGAIAVIKRIA